MPQGLPTDALVTTPAMDGLPADALANQAGSAGPLTSEAHPDHPSGHGAPETNLGVIGTLKQYAHMPVDVYHAFTQPPVDKNEEGLARGGGPLALGAKRLLYDPAQAEQTKAQRLFASGKSKAGKEKIADYIEGAGHVLAGAIPMFGPWASQIGQQIQDGDAAGAVTNATVGALLPRIQEKVMGVARNVGRFGTAGDLEIAQKMPNSAAGLTQDEVVGAAKARGIDLTAAQRTGSSVLQHAEEFGKGSLVTKNLVEQGKKAESGVHAWVDDLQGRMDPKGRGGETHDALGTDLSRQASDVFQQRKASVDQAYGNSKSRIAKHVDNVDLTNVEKFAQSLETDPATGQPQTYMPPQVKALVERLKNIHAEVSGDPTKQAKVTFSAAKDLRTEAMDHVDYKDPLPGQAKGIWKKVGGLVGDSIDAAAGQKGPGFQEEWRQLNAGNSALHETFEKGVMQQLLENDNKNALGRAMLADSPEHIRTMKQNGIDISGIRRAVLSDMKSKNFSLRGNKMGGYSDATIQELYGEHAREVHQLAQTARNVGYNVNPSGSGKLVGMVTQLQGLIGSLGAVAHGGTPAAASAAAAASPAITDIALSRPGVQKSLSRPPQPAPPMGSKALALTQAKKDRQ